MVNRTRRSVLEGTEDLGTLCLPPSWVLPALLCAAGCLAAVPAVRVAAGLPYDEPEHWHNVLFYAHHLRLPVMGVDDVRYLTGASFSSVDVSVFYLARTAATYLVLPTEYVRNTIAAPPTVDLVVVAVFAGLARRWLLVGRWAFAGVAGVAALSAASQVTGPGL